MEYIVMITTTKDEEKKIYYIGKDGYVHDRIEYVDAWKRERFAREYIEKHKGWERGSDWNYEYKILIRD